MKQKLLILFAFLLIGISSKVQAYDFSAVCSTGQTLYYNVTSSSLKTVELTSQNVTEPYYSNYPTGALTIPSIVTYGGATYTVTSVGRSSFSFCYSLTSITIPSSVTSIGMSSFSFCYSLTSITIPSSVTSIGIGAFFYCTGLTSVIIPNSVTSIGYDAFYNTPYYNNMPDGVVYINNVLYKYKGSMPANTTVNISMGTIKISDYAFQGFTDLTTITIPNSVTSIGDWAFEGCTGITTITIPNSVTSIGSGTFYGCTGLTTITIPNSVTSIGEEAFLNCTGLSTLLIPNSITSIGGNAFSNTLYYNNMPNGVIYINNVLYKYKGTMPANTTINIPMGIISISGSAFDGCTGLNTITIPNSVISIGSYAFSGCIGLITIPIPNSITLIGDNVFNECTGLTSITIPSSVTSIGYGAFSECTSLSTITIPNSVTSLGRNVFYGCTGLSSIIIPSSITSIEKNTFYGCIGLTTITIPNAATSIGDFAFYNCSSLSSITSNAIKPPYVFSNSFNGVNKSIPLYVPCTSNYQSASYWSAFTNIIGNNNYDTTYYDTICRGGLYNKYGFNFSVDTAGLYTQHLQTISGCDSIIKLELSFVTSPKQDINMVTVDNSNHNVVVWDKKEFVNHYNIYREGVVMGQFDLIATVPYDSLGIYVDTNSNPTVKAYMYKVSTTDTCMNESELSTSHKTMHLTIGQGMGNNWNLNWTPYEGANYSTYNIYRGINSLDSLKYLTTISASNTSYTDINVPSGYVYYQVEILKDTATSNKSNGINSIRSNYATNKVVSLDDVSKNNTSIRIFPNPAKTNITIDYSNNSSLNKYTIQIYNTLGQMVYNNTIKQQIFNIDVSKWNNKGLYNVRIIDSTNKIIATEKVVVQ